MISTIDMQQQFRFSFRCGYQLIFKTSAFLSSFYINVYPEFQFESLFNKERYHQEIGIHYETRKQRGQLQLLIFVEEEEFACNKRQQFSTENRHPEVNMKIPCNLYPLEPRKFNVIGSIHKTSAKHN